MLRPYHARGLFFQLPHNHLHLRGHVAVKLDRHAEFAQLLQRLVEMDLALLDVETGMSWE